MRCVVGGYLKVFLDVLDGVQNHFGVKVMESEDRKLQEITVFGKAPHGQHYVHRASCLLPPTGPNQRQY
jgi:hypothetical protein